MTQSKLKEAIKALEPFAEVYSSMNVDGDLQSVEEDLQRELDQCVVELEIKIGDFRKAYELVEENK